MNALFWFSLGALVGLPFGYWIGWATDDTKPVSVRIVCKWVTA